MSGCTARSRPKPPSRRPARGQPSRPASTGSATTTRSARTRRWPGPRPAAPRPRRFPPVSTSLAMTPTTRSAGALQRRDQVGRHPVFVSEALVGEPVGIAEPRPATGSSACRPPARPHRPPYPQAPPLCVGPAGSAQSATGTTPENCQRCFRSIVSTMSPVAQRLRLRVSDCVVCQVAQASFRTSRALALRRTRSLRARRRGSLSWACRQGTVAGMSEVGIVAGDDLGDEDEQVRNLRRGPRAPAASRALAAVVRDRGEAASLAAALLDRCRSRAAASRRATVRSATPLIARKAGRAPATADRRRAGPDRLLELAHLALEQAMSSSNKARTSGSATRRRWLRWAVRISVSWRRRVTRAAVAPGPRWPAPGPRCPWSRHTRR